MTTAMQTGVAATSAHTEGTDPQLAALLARQNQLAETIQRRGAEVVRAWLIANERTWLAVDITKSLLEPPVRRRGRAGRCGQESAQAGVRQRPGRARQLHRAAGRPERVPRAGP